MSFQEKAVTFATETTTFNGMKTSNVCHINGKEKDFETGYHYYGARYYDSEKINWLSVDPLSDKYPSMSPYAYCANNPVILVDPDGESPVKAILSAVKISHKLYKIYKKTGKITSKSLKNAGLEEFIDIGGDIQTIFSGDATVLDRINAVADLIIGTDLNNKGQKAVKNILEKDNNSKLRKTNPSKAESKIWNDFKPFKKILKLAEKERKEDITNGIILIMTLRFTILKVSIKALWIQPRVICIRKTFLEDD